MNLNSTLAGILGRITGENGPATAICANASAGRQAESDADEATTRDEVLAIGRISNDSSLAWTNRSFLVA